MNQILVCWAVDTRSLLYKYTRCSLDCVSTQLSVVARERIENLSQNHEVRKGEMCCPTQPELTPER